MVKAILIPIHFHKFKKFEEIYETIVETILNLVVHFEIIISIHWYRYMKKYVT